MKKTKGDSLAEEKLLTVLTPTWNCALTLQETLNSVVALERFLPGRCEHLIGDSYSTDGTAEILDAYADTRPWVKVRKIRGSIPVTLNALLPEMGGRWVVVLNGDDRFYPDGIAAALASAPDGGRPVVLCGTVRMLNKHGDFLGVRRCEAGRMDKFMSVNHPASLAHRSVFDIAGTYDPAMPTSYDYGWMWQAWHKGVEFHCFPEIWAEMRLGGISDKNAARAHSEIFRYKASHGAFLSAARGYFSFQVKSFVRKILPGVLVRPLVSQYRKAKSSIDEY